MLLTILVFLLILSVLVLIHEAGHFFVAKRLKIKVEEFGFGLPPRAFGIKRGETIYSINWLPIGGFVKLYGEDEAGGGSLKISKSKKLTDEKRAFYARSVGQRAGVVLAGVLMNTLLAVVIFYIFLAFSNFKTTLPLLGDHRFFFVNQTIVGDNTTIVDEVSPNSPAQEIGIKPPSRILSVNNITVTNTQYFLDAVNHNKGKQITISWQDLRTGKRLSASVTPRVSPPPGQGSLGVRISSSTIPTATISYDTPMQKIFSGFIHPANLLVYTFDVFGKLISISFAQKSVAPVSEGVSGPIGIASVVSAQLDLPTLKEKIMGLLNLAGLLSISLAFFNVLPIPGLDGGRLFFIIIEAVTRKKVPAKYEGLAHTIGIGVLLALIALITVHDIARLLPH
ncbi:MAG TPA: site-2 protease family protein [Candidatus Saccharimonadales bacterium]|nr:site-2 protease family protein [Candidatus Saccharimonadales bacterium]